MSTVGDGITLGALPLLATLLTNDPRLIAGVTFVSFLPWLLLALPCGVIVDRYDRKKLMVVANSARCVLLVLVGLAASASWFNIWVLYGLLALIGVGEVLFDSSALAFIPAIVEPDQLQQANGLRSLADNVGALFIGQPLGAMLFAAAVGLPFGVDAVSFALSAALIAGIAMPQRETRGEQPAAATASFRSDIADGVRRLWSHQLLRRLALLLGVVNFAGFMGLAIFVKFALETLGVERNWYGGLLALMAFGAMIGALGGDAIASRLGRSSALTMSYMAIGIAAIGTGLSPNYWFVAAFSLLDGMAVTIWNVISVSARQRLVPTEQFGRINSIFRWLSTGASALGALVGGQLAHSFNYRLPYIVGGVIIVAAALFARKALSQSQIDLGERAAWAA